MTSLPADLVTLDPAAAAAFFARVPTLYAQGQARLQEDYQRLLYQTEHEFSREDLTAIGTAFGYANVTWLPEAADEVIRVFDAMHYPDTMPIANLRAIPGMDLSLASTILHFFHHTYPIYDRDSCKGLEQLGFPLGYSKVRDADIYTAYIAAIEALREKIPFWFVPETNVHLNRVIQCALAQLGQET